MVFQPAAAGRRRNRRAPAPAPGGNLLDALARNKPFRRFRDVVHTDLALRDQWFAFRDETLARHARNWLASLGIDAEPQRRQP